MAMPLKIKNVPEDKEGSGSVGSSVSSPLINNINAPKYGTVVPNRVFVGGISPLTTELELSQLFASYGQVTSSKIIFDRAGVSKGYGFVTFKSEEEAKRLQKDVTQPCYTKSVYWSSWSSPPGIEHTITQNCARVYDNIHNADNIVLKERRLNIAPAIRKQGYGRMYESMNSGPGGNQMYRPNGLAYTTTYNGVTYFPQQSPGLQAQAMTPVPTNVEPQAVYPAGAYGGMPQNNNTVPYPYSFPPQGHVFYQSPHYSYPVAQYDGGYQLAEGHGGLLMPTGPDSNVIIPGPYYISAQGPPPELYYQTQRPVSTAPPIASLPQDSVQPMIYQSPRGYETTVFYPEPKKADESVEKDEPKEQPVVPPPSPHSKDDTPVVSLLKVYDQNGEKPQPGQQPTRGKPTGAVARNYSPRKPAPSPRPYNLNLNNNNPDLTSQNVGRKPRRMFHNPPQPPCYSSQVHGPNPAQYNKPYQDYRPHHLPNPQVPQFPFHFGPRNFSGASQAAPAYSAQPRRGQVYSRSRYNGRGGKTRPKSGYYKENGSSESGPEEPPNALTPPVTPQSSQHGLSHPQTEQVQAALQTLTI